MTCDSGNGMRTQPKPGGAAGGGGLAGGQGGEERLFTGLFGSEMSTQSPNVHVGCDAAVVSQPPTTQCRSRLTPPVLGPCAVKRVVADASATPLSESMEMEWPKRPAPTVSPSRRGAHGRVWDAFSAPQGSEATRACCDEFWLSKGPNVYTAPMSKSPGAPTSSENPLPSDRRCHAIEKPNSLRRAPSLLAGKILAV